MTINQYGALLEKAIQHSFPILVVGPPGVGKSYEAAAVCKRLGRDFIPVSGPLLSPVKVGGYPRAPLTPDGDASHALFNGIARAFRATSPTVLFIDDLGLANGETLKALLDLVQFGRIDDRKLPDCVSIQAASNDVGHGADVQGMIEPLKNRWTSIVHVEQSADDIVQYGLADGWPGWFLGWIRHSEKDIIGSWKPTKSLTVEGCTSRGLEHVAKMDLVGIDGVEEWAGAIGKGHAVAALAFKRLQADLPDITQIFLDPDGAPVPADPGAKWLVSMAIASNLSSENFGSGMKYLLRLPQMFRSLSTRDALKAESTRVRDGKFGAHRPITSSRDYIAWAVSKDGQDILMALQD
jgi:hypothetical protein